MSIASQYDKKQTTGVKVAKRFQADPKTIRIIDGFNYRALSQEHVNMFAEAYVLGGSKMPPPIVVAVGDDGVLELVDGEHRLRAALQAGVDMVDLQEFKGERKERRAAAMRFNQGRKASSTERARAYLAQREENGWSNAEIARQCAVSEGEVANHILLAMCGDEVIARVDRGEVKATPIIQLARSIGPHAVLDKLRETAKDVGEERVKGKHLSPTKRREDKQQAKIVAEVEDADSERRASSLLKMMLPLLAEIETVSKLDNATPNSASLTLRCDAGTYRKVQGIQEMIADLMAEKAKG